VLNIKQKNCVVKGIKQRKGKNVRPRLRPGMLLIIHSFN